MKSITATIILWLLVGSSGVIGCAALGGDGIKLALVEQGMESLHAGFDEMDKRIRNGEGLTESAKKGLLATLSDMKTKQKELGEALEKTGEISPETAAAGTGLLGLILTLVMNALGQKKKLKNTRKDMYAMNGKKD